MKDSGRRLRLMLLLMCGLFVLCAQQSRVRAGTLTVNTVSDTPQNVCDGLLSLREAMLLSAGVNSLGRPLTAGEQSMVTGAVTWSGTVPAPPGCSSNLGPYRFVTSGVGGNVRDDVLFALNVDTVLLTAGLPEITWGLDNINGLKSDGTKVTLNGSSAGVTSGITIIGGALDVSIRNLIIQNFQQHGIFISGSDNCVFEGLEIFNNGIDGISITPYTFISGVLNSRNNHIGGTALSQRNFIHLNGRNGITITADANADRTTDQGNIIENSFIGLKSNGNQDSGNGRQGIRLQQAFGNRIGGDTVASRNVISGNDDNGILLDGDGCYSNRILNNFIGTNKDGNALIGNSGSGVALAQGAGDPVGPSSSPNLIGDAGKGNVIGGNFFGVGMFDANTDHNIVRGNFIGTDLTASLNLGNVRDAVFISLSHDNQIGGTGAGEANVFAYNGGAGVYVQGGTANNIRGNRIFLNTDLGVDLDPGGVQPNDFMDADVGSNNLQNFPVIASGSSAGGNTTVRGSINTTPNTSLTLDFFVSPDRDPSGFGEGSVYIGSAAFTTDSGGNAVFNNTFATGVSFQGFYSTATATDASGNTSEFSQAFKLGCSYTLPFPASQSFPVTGGSGSFNLNTTSACDWQAVRSDSWITITGGASGTGNGTVSYTVASNTGAARTGTITVGGRVYTITQAGCTYSLTHYTASYPASGVSVDGVSVIADAGSCPWTAVSNASWIQISSGSSGSGNGNVLWYVQPNSCGARRGTVTVAGQTFIINQASVTTRRSPFDFDGDGRTDIAVFRPSQEVWYLYLSCSGSFTGAVWGYRTDKLVPADYDGDGITDFAVWRPSNGYWYLYQSRDGYRETSWGAASLGDVPVPADYDGDGKADIAVYRPGASTGQWSYFYMLPSGSPPGTYTQEHWGQYGDVPVPADYDGDGKANLAVFRASEKTWHIQMASAPGGIFSFQFGNPTDKLVPGDYDGDGKADIAVFRPENNYWYLQQSSAGYDAKTIDAPNAIPVPGDYNGDGKWDVAVYAPASGGWGVIYSGNNGSGYFGFGANGDIPIPSVYVR